MRNNEKIASSRKGAFESSFANGLDLSEFSSTGGCGGDAGGERRLSASAALMQVKAKEAENNLLHEVEEARMQERVRKRTEYIQKAAVFASVGSKKKHKQQQQQQRGEIMLHAAPPTASALSKVEASATFLAHTQARNYLQKTGNNSTTTTNNNNNNNNSICAAALAAASATTMGMNEFETRRGREKRRSVQRHPRRQHKQHHNKNKSPTAKKGKQQQRITKKSTRIKH